MKKNFKTIAIIGAAISGLISPAANNNNIANARSIEIVQANKSAVLPRQEKKQGITINNTGGGLDFNMPKMMEYSNPI